MATRIPDAVRNAVADAVVDRVDAGATAGTVKVYTGTQPATAATAATGTLLATITLNDPAFGTAATGAAALVTSPALSTTAVAAGTPGWYRVADSTGATVFDGSLTGASTVSVGDTVSITAATVTAPATT